MAYWLFKQEPSCYSFADLERDGETVWDGVANALALQHLRQVKRGDEILFYHTGAEKAVVGRMAAAADAVDDPAAKTATVKVRTPRPLPTSVPLAAIKADPAFAGWELLRNSRLSIMPVTEKMWRRVLALGEKPNASRPAEKARPPRPNRRRRA